MVTLGWRVYYSSGSLLTLAHRLPLRPQTLKSTHFLMASTTTLLSAGHQGKCTFHASYTTCSTERAFAAAISAL